MQALQKTQKNLESQLILKNAEIHAQKLNQLQKKINLLNSKNFPNSNSILEQTVENRFDTTSNSKCIPSQILNNQKYIQKTPKKQVIFIKSPKYFNNISLNNIANENKILFKKIRTIVKAKNKVFDISLNKQKKSNSILENHLSENNQLLNVSSKLAEELNTKKASRSQQKQMEIRDANLKMLERLSNLKPTMSTKQILSQTKKSQDISKRISKFNTIQSIEAEQNISQQQAAKNSLAERKKRLSLDIKTQDIQNNLLVECKKLKKNKLFLGNQEVSSPYSKHLLSFRRFNTEPIESLFDIKLPQLSVTHKNSLSSFNIEQKVAQHNHRRSHTTNDRYLQKVKNQPHLNREPKFLQKHRMSLSIDDETSRKNNKVLRKKHSVETYKPVQNAQFLSKQKETRKVVTLAEIQMFLQTIKIKFCFIRTNSFYQIQFRKDVSNDLQKQKAKGSSEKKLQQNLNSEYKVTKIYDPANKIKNNLASQQRCFRQEKISIKDGRMILEESVGSSLFSFFDYDYRRIVQNCLEVKRINKNLYIFVMKEEYKNNSWKNNAAKFQNHSIRESNQDQEDDPIDRDLKL